jgi:hypothetical protein
MSTFSTLLLTFSIYGIIGLILGVMLWITTPPIHKKDFPEELIDTMVLFWPLIICTYFVQLFKGKK